MDTDYLKRVGIYIVSALLSLGIIIYFGYHIWSSFKPDVKTEAVMQSTVTKTVDSECYIFRYELPLSASTDGVLVPTKSDGERVRAFGETAGIYSNADPDTVRKIDEIDVQIELLSEASSDGATTLKDAAKIDEELYSVMTAIRQSLAKGDAAAAESLRQELIAGTNKKDVIMGNSGDVSLQLSELRGKRQELVASLGTRIGSVTSQKSGFYYSIADGFETVFDPALFDGIDYDSLHTLATESAPAEKASGGKVVTQTKWYAVCFVDKGIGSLLSEGEDRDVAFPYNGTTLNMTLENLIRGDDGYACIFSCSDMPTGFEFTRVQPVKISLAEYTGFKVRISDVRIIDGKQGVYVLDGSTVRFRLISTVTDHEGYFIVETDPQTETNVSDETEKEGETTELPEGQYYYLRLHDLIITEGTGLYDGLILGK